MTNICLFNTTTGCPPLCDDQSPCSSICNNKGVSIERPWSRFNFVCQSTEFDRLQMRRKAEVLQYKNNSSKLTKKQRYSLAAKNLLTKKKSWANQKEGVVTNPNTSNLKPTGFYQNNINNSTFNSWTGLTCCPADQKVSSQPSNIDSQNQISCSNPPSTNQFLTTQSDVPGKPMFLKYEPDFPLTMFPPVRRTYKGGAGKWPQVSWYRGANGFPVGKKGNVTN